MTGKNIKNQEKQKQFKDMTVLYVYLEINKTSNCVDCKIVDLLMFGGYIAIKGESIHNAGLNMITNLCKETQNTGNNCNYKFCFSDFTDWSSLQTSTSTNENFNKETTNTNTKRND